MCMLVCLCVCELASFIVPILQQLLRGRASFPLSQRSPQWPIVIALICKSSVVCRKLSACKSVCACECDYANGHECICRFVFSFVA